MFSYIDENVRRILGESGRLVHLDRDGETVTSDDQKEKIFLSMLGPVPLPVDVGGSERVFQWYAFVRRSELGQIEEVAAKVRSDNLKDLWPLVSSYMAVNSLLVYGDFGSLVIFDFIDPAAVLPVTVVRVLFVTPLQGVGSFGDIVGLQRPVSVIASTDGILHHIVDIES